MYSRTASTLVIATHYIVYNDTRETCHSSLKMQILSINYIKFACEKYSLSKWYYREEMIIITKLCGLHYNPCIGKLCFYDFFLFEIRNYGDRLSWLLMLRFPRLLLRLHKFLHNYKCLRLVETGQAILPL